MFYLTTVLRLVNNHFGCRLIHFEQDICFLDLRSLLLKVGCERLYLLLLLRDGCLQTLNCAVEHRLLCRIGNGLGPNAAFGRKSTRVACIHADGAQSSIGIDHHDSGRRGGNRRTKDIVNGAPVTDLTKNTVHPRVVTDDDIVIGGGDARPSHAAHGNVVARGYTALERLITNGCVVVSGSVGSERVTTYRGEGAAGSVVHERKITSSGVSGTAAVKDERVGPNGGVLCAGGVEQERHRANCSVRIGGVESQRSSADTGIETAGGI